MTNEDFEARVIRAQEGKLTVAKDYLLMYERQRGVMEKKFEAENEEYHVVKENVRKWRDDVNMNVRILQTMREVSGIPVDAPILKPLQEEVEAKPATPFPAGSNGQHLADALRKAKGWRLGIPLAPSYHHCPSAFAYQAIKREIMNHVDYESMLAAGNVFRVSDGNLSRTNDDLYKAAAKFGIDAEAVRREAYNVYYDITSYGRSWEHYKW